MRRSNQTTRTALAAVVLAGLASLGACGGGGGGGGNGGAPDHLNIQGAVMFGTVNGGVVTEMVFPTLPSNPGVNPPVPVPPGGSTAVAAAAFPAGVAGRQDYLTLNFNADVLASSVATGGLGTDGIVITRLDPMTGNSVQVPFVLDATGAVDPTNAFPEPDRAPATLRLYYSQMDSDPATAEAFPNGEYVVSVTNALRSWNNMPFCVSGSGSNCQNPYLPELSFSVGGVNTALTMKQSIAGGPGASVPSNNDNSVPLNSEIVLNFDKAVAFETLVGAGNLTTLDPFITVPFPLVGGPCLGPTAMMPSSEVGVDIGNLYVGLRMPVDPGSGTFELPPVTLAAIAYMPDPFHNPTQVRVRFVNSMGLSGVDVQPNGPFQNYASNPTKLPLQTRSQALITQANNQGQPVPILTLPAIQPVPGSLPTYVPSANFTTDPTAMIGEVVVAGVNFADPMGTGCSAPAGAGASRTGQAFDFQAGVQSDFYLRFAFQAGQALARNPHPPDLTVVGTQVQPLTGVAAINVATSTTNICGAPDTSAPLAAGAALIGNFILEPNRLSNPAILGTPIDLEIGNWIFGGNLGSAPRRNGANPGLPLSQGGFSADILGTVLTCGMPTPLGPPWGNYLYVVDGDANELRVLNSYDFTPVQTITGVSSPSGLGIEPNLGFLYVANQNSGTVQRIDANPARASFHQIVQRISVGAGPRSVSVAPSNEDILVANYGENTVSIIDGLSLTERFRVAAPSMIGPADIHITNRMLCMGCTLAYTAFIPCSLSGNVVMYESDSPAVPENGIEGSVKGNIGGFSFPKGGTWNWLSVVNIISGNGPGAFIVNAQGTSVSEVSMVNFTLSPMPGFPGPAGRRDYLRRREFAAGNVTGLPIRPDSRPSDASLNALAGWNPMAGSGKGVADQGIPANLLVSYPSEGVVASYDGTNGGLLATVSVPGCDLLHSWYDQ